MSYVRAFRPFLLLTLIVAACSDGSTAPGDPNHDPEPVGVPSLSVVSGSGQTDTVMQALDAPLIVRVAYDDGTPVAGHVVNFRVTNPACGTLFASAAQTDEDGKAADIWTLGTLAGPCRVEVRAVTGDGVPMVYDTFAATALAGPLDTIIAPDRLVFDGPFVLAGVAGADAFGNPIPLALSAPSASFIISGDTIRRAMGPVIDTVRVLHDGIEVDRFATAAFDSLLTGKLVAAVRCYDGYLRTSTTAHEVEHWDSVSFVAEYGDSMIGTPDEGMNGSALNFRNRVVNVSWEQITWLDDGTADTLRHETTSQIQQIVPRGVASEPDTMWIGFGGAPVIRMSPSTWTAPAPLTGDGEMCQDFLGGTDMTLEATAW